MKIKEFNYTKKDGEKTNRLVVVLRSMDTYEDCIDMGHLTEQEQKDVLSIQTDYELKMAPYMKKSFRRFSKDGMEVLNEDDVKPQAEFTTEQVHYVINK